MLNAYILSTQQLLQYPAAPSSLYSTTDLTTWINEGRNQLAGQSNCVRFLASLPFVSAQNVYPYSAISLSGATGIASVLHVRDMWLQVASGQVKMRPRSWEWFGQYEFNAAIPNTGQPIVWAQYAQGGLLSLYVSPIPNAAFTALLDCVCLPAALSTDASPEVIPALWTDAVPYYAAYKALLSAQSVARQADAERMFNRFEEFANRGRKAATPEVLPGQYEQQMSPVRPNQLGLGKSKGLLG